MSLSALASAAAQTGLEPTPRFPLSDGPLVIHQAVQPQHPFTVTGATGAILGLQNGSVEVWALPTKVFTNLHLTAEVAGYSVPIDLNAAAAAIDVHPDHTTITYSHAAITVRQHMFVPAGDENTAIGPMILFEIESIKPAVLTVSLEPAMLQQWPAPTFGRPSTNWVAMGSGGAFVLSTDNPENFGMVGMPNASAGIIAPYQERPQALPLQFKVHFDPKLDSQRLFPLVVAVSKRGEKNTPAAVAAMQARLSATANALPETYRQTRAYYERFFDRRLSVKTPDPKFDAAMRWAEIAIEQSKVRTGDETGLVAGWYPSFDSTRPGFGWYFGRDTLWSLYAVNSYGDEALAKQALEFLSKRQRADGKMMHEFSLTAEMLHGDLDWAKLGYEYAAADATPLFIMAVADYVRVTGDVDFLRAHWEQVKKAYEFDRSHDSDGDGVYDNSEGTGWVEAWPPKMPQQEIYLAALDRTSSAALSELATLMRDEALALSATAQAQHVGEAIGNYRQSDGMYAFSLDRDGAYDKTSSVFPSVALWTDGASLPRPEAMLSAWASHEFATDWGVRSVNDTAAVFDPISYHQGSVWPLFTGWVSLAEYRSGRPLAGYAALMRNVELSWAQDPGFLTEVLSGEFFQPLGRSSSHQLWSSAMVLAPAIRGLFGVEADATHRTLRIQPHLPPGWDSAELDNVRVGDDLYTINLNRERGHLLATVRSANKTVLCLSGEPDGDSKECRERATTLHTLSLPLPAVEVTLDGERVPEAGATTSQPRVIEESYHPGGLSLVIEGVAGSTAGLSVRRNSALPQGKGDPALKVYGAELSGEKLKVAFPQGSGFVSQPIRISWPE
ncbi:amylo-alpha-1,6-glucosidase [Edaphobacter aggregans]|uniref:amylo-alpha-1,6-glucosidase n=1 Tax=Edaphobacter aggregans TaxID=570835 RepID=UPI001B802621|nr:glycogen debranching protein [Edaphobacter aggregans]